jgi:hypothetical protein
MTEPQEAPKQTLDEMLDLLNRQDTELLDFDPEVLVGDLALKIDGYHHIIGRFEDTGEMFKREAQRLAEVAKTCESKARRVKEILLFNMQKHGFEKLPGVFFRAQIQETKSYDIIDQRFENPDSILSMAHPEWVERQYVVQKKAMIDSFKSDPESMKEIMTERKTPFVRFYPNTAGETKGKTKKD